MLQQSHPLESLDQLSAQAWYSRPAPEWSAADALLAHASAIVAEKRAKVQAALGFTLSAGVAHSKLLAKLCSGLNKPNQQTVLPWSFVADLLHDLPLSKLRGLGGQLGERVQSELGIDKIGMSYSTFRCTLIRCMKSIVHLVQDMQDVQTASL